MPVPTRWIDILRSPAFVINLDTRPDRLAASMAALNDAGFTEVRRFRAIDASDAGALAASWNAVGSPPFAAWDTKFTTLPGKQGCFLSHLTLWETIINNDLSFASIFEDDVTFHRHWGQLAPTCFDFTQGDYDLLFMGNEIDVPGHGLVRRVPVYCTHAYVITREGAETMRSLLLNDPQGVATIDCMIHDHQWREYSGQGNCPFSWYAWNGTTFPDGVALKYPEWQRRNTGLVFQNFDLGSDVELT